MSTSAVIDVPSATQAPAATKAASAPAPLVRRGRRRRESKRSQSLAAAWMIAPACILLVLFIIIPIALMFGLAFTDAKLVSPQSPRMIWLDNFARLFSDPLFWKSLRNTTIFAAVVVPVQAGWPSGSPCW